MTMSSMSTSAGPKHWIDIELIVIREQTKASLKKTGRANAPRRVGENFRAAFCANGDGSRHVAGRTIRCPNIILQKIFAQVTRAIRQLNAAAHPQYRPAPLRYGRFPRARVDGNADVTGGTLASPRSQSFRIRVQCPLAKDGLVRP